MPETSQFLAERLRTEGEKTVEFFRQTPAPQWSQQIYSDGSGWTAGQILIHFISTEEAIQALIADVLAGGAGAAEGFDIDAFNEREVVRLGNLPVHDLLDRFAELRQKTAAIVAQMRPDDLQRMGRHPFLGVVALADTIKLLYRHNQIHIRDIRHLSSGD
jgi:hypothetical protein